MKRRPTNTPQTDFPHAMSRLEAQNGRTTKEVRNASFQKIRDEWNVHFVEEKKREELNKVQHISKDTITKKRC